jgi:hypothetical protein
MACILLVVISAKEGKKMAKIKYICIEIKSFLEKFFKSEWISYDEFWSKALEKREPIQL